jgi:hypothetical protein
VANLSYFQSIDGRACHLLKGAKRRAKDRGLEFSLSPEWLATRLKIGSCVLTGIKFDYSIKTQGRCNPFAPSIDRVDCSEGYTESNCRVVVWIYNVMRQDFTDEEIQAFAASMFVRDAAPH